MSKHRFYARPRWRNPGKAWEPRNRRQERKYKTPRAFTVRAEWRYGNNRTEAREERVKQQARRLLGIAAFVDRVKRRFFPHWKPERINPDYYHVEV